MPQPPQTQAHDGTAPNQAQPSNSNPVGKLHRHKPSALSLAAMAAAAVKGLDPARLALPQTQSADLRVVGVIDTQGRHWEVLQALHDATGAAIDAEAEVLRIIGKIYDEGRLSFDVCRPAGSLRRDGIHIQVRSHIAGRPIELADLHPGPGLSAGLGKALGQLHELPPAVVAQAGLPVYDAEEVRQHWLSMLDEAAASGLVPPALLSRWEQALENTALWRFRPTVVHGDLAEENLLVAGGAIVALRGLTQIHVGDPAEDLAWIYASAPIECLDSIEAEYDLTRREGVDKHLHERAELVSEMRLAHWLLHGVRTQNQEIVDDAVSMLIDLLEQVGEAPLSPAQEPHLSVVSSPQPAADAEAELEPDAQPAPTHPHPRESGSDSESALAAKNAAPARGEASHTASSAASAAARDAAATQPIAQVVARGESSAADA